MLPRLDRIVAAVQRNCHITDARHARGMTLCTYLLEMREFFRWEHGLPLGEAPPRAEVGRWLSEREALWESLEEEDFGPVSVGAEAFEPFDSEGVNRRLLDAGLVYGAGIGRFGKPHFFLGRLERVEVGAGPRILVCGCEYARDLTAIPAALQNGTIVVRQEALRQWLWEKAEAWGIKKQAGAMQRALAGYAYDADPAAALERMTRAETESVILHERGEYAAGQALGPEWEEMLLGLGKRRAELLARAVRDNLADCLVTLPRLIDARAWPSLHFWFANFDGMRRELFPALGEAYRQWCEAGDREPLETAARQGALHWAGVAGRLLERARAAGPEAGAEFERLSHDLGSLAL